MKNIAFIKSTIASFVELATPEWLVDNMTTLIQAIPEETRENALAIVTGTAELTVRAADQVEIKCTNDKYSNLSFKSEPKANLLNGTVECYTNYTRTEPRWYKSEEDADAGMGYSNYKHDDYIVERVISRDDSLCVTFDLAEWNTGQVTWKR